MHRHIHSAYGTYILSEEESMGSDNILYPEDIVEPNKQTYEHEYVCIKD